MEQKERAGREVLGRDTVAEGTCGFPRYRCNLEDKP